jgi:hypothetical protein
MAKVDINDLYTQYAETIDQFRGAEIKLYNIKRLSESIKSELIEFDNGSVGIEFTGHAFKQISERLESLSMENFLVHQGVFKENPSDNLLLPSNLKPFIINLLAKARSDNSFTEQLSKSNDGCKEYRYIVDLSEWSDDSKTLQLTCIVENNCIKTGYFNWI